MYLNFVLSLTVSIAITACLKVMDVHGILVFIGFLVGVFVGYQMPNINLRKTYGYIVKMIRH